MTSSADETLERAAVLALSVHSKRAWHEVAQAIEHVGSALQMIRIARLDGPTTIIDACGRTITDEDLRAASDAASIDQHELETFLQLIADVIAEGDDLVTVLDDRYPTNLRLVHDRPPFLFTKGTHRPDDERAIAVVGTRQASPQGLAFARRFAGELAQRDVTVVSGLAKGIDRAAHEGALEHGGRTVAVVGTGIRRTYPAEHRELAQRIVAEGGAILSQFLPDSPPRRENFPLRNRTMSGYAVGTVVVEASETSGAKMQARLALQHNKRLFLVRELVMRESWAANYAERPGALIVDTVEDVLAVLDSELAPAAQLSFG